MSVELPKAYQPTEVEPGISFLWEKCGASAPHGTPDALSYCIVLPPPNRTGTLHMGHATMLAIQDTLIRYHRMLGERTLWIPGTDHAAIATQVKVEQLLRKQGMADPRRELGREKFLDKVKEFAEQSRETINMQVRAMGSSCDWNHETYTLDAERNRAVFEMFKRMHEDGIIERGYRLVNWDPQFQTTLSDDEVQSKAVKAKMLTFTYDKDFPIAISTTRPETKFGDVAVAVHPDDARYQSLIGKQFHPIFCGVQLDIQIIADSAVDPSFGTGALGVTPAHSMIDGEIAERHGLKTVPVIDKAAKISHPSAGEFLGLSVAEARGKIEAHLQASGCLISVEEIDQNLPVAERGGAPVEILPMEQWFVRVNKPFALRQNTLGKWKKGEMVTLKELMREAVATEGMPKERVQIVPTRFEKTYFHWINNLRDWCISRQIWFGHRIPVWYKDGEIQVSQISPGEGWEQDPDTLDTWFSSGMWTFSTLGWPEAASIDAEGNLVKTGELALFHPTAVLETGYDILFFWVARMILMSTYALGEIPFKDVYLHGLVRDENGNKMSKSLGNILDPLDLIPKYGTDAVRMSVLMGSTPGQDMKLSETKIESLKHFTNKLWNISRFVIGKVGETEWLRKDRAATEILPHAKTLADRWILSELQQVIEKQTQGFATYHLSQAAEALSEFTWTVFADWYIEIAKVEGDKTEILAYVLRNLLKLWHPFMPFVTEAIWQASEMGGNLISATYPSAASNIDNTEDASVMDRLRALVTDGRRLRAEAKLDATKKFAFQLICTDQIWNEIEGNIAWMIRLLGATSLERVVAFPSGMISTPTGTSLIGIVQEAASGDDKERLQKELDEAKKYEEDLKRRLANTEFISKAPEKVVKDIESKLAETVAKIERLNGQLSV